MTTLTFNNQKGNYGFVGPITKEEAIHMATVLGIPEDTHFINKDYGDVNPFIESPTFYTENETIIIETGYGISFEKDLLTLITDGLEKAGFTLIK